MANQAIVILPTYNEAANLPIILANIVNNVPQVDILVVDDNSPDGTGDIADQWAAKHEQIRVLHRTEKGGLGTAYIFAFKWALAEGYRYLIEMDADGSHPYTALPRMLELAGTHDLVLGSRWIPGGDVSNWSKRREWLSRGGNFYTRVLLRLPVHDASGGFRAYHRRIFDRVNLNQVASKGYSFQIDLVLRIMAQPFSVVEFPITFVDRTLGQSKMSGRVALESLLRITGWAFTRQQRYRANASVVRH